MTEEKKSLLTIKDGDALEATEKYLVHQCNCKTQKAAHMAASMFQRFPYADDYTGRTVASVPGTIAIKGSVTQGQRLVVNLFGQYYPGVSRYPNDTYVKRAQWFKSGLLALEKGLEAGDTIALPFRIGCGAAGGDWSAYLEVLEQWAEKIKDKATITLYRFQTTSNLSK